MKITTARPTVEGAGVNLCRAFGNNEIPLYDPFLLLDDIGSANPDDYTAGFPWHPHRGIETVTYLLNGEVEHGDSLENTGIIRSGEAQWMTAGGGIIHQEMPHKYNGSMRGFQLWINLPSTHKMMDPRYRDIKKDAIPVLSPKKGVRIKIISGIYNNIRGPVRDIVTRIEYLDITMDPHTAFTLPLKSGWTTFLYGIEGKGFVGPDKKVIISAKTVLFQEGDTADCHTTTEGLRMLFVAGKPIGEPIAWGGPIVMNTQEELRKAFSDLQDGSFIKRSSA